MNGEPWWPLQFAPVGTGILADNEQVIRWAILGQDEKIIYIMQTKSCYWVVPSIGLAKQGFDRYQCAHLLDVRAVLREVFSDGETR